MTTERARSYVDANGYRRVKVPGHHKADRNGFVKEHLIFAERMLGRKLVAGEVVHHTDLAKGIINPFGLVVCSSQAEHQTLHRQVRAFMATGNIEARRCHICHTYDNIENLYGNDKKGFRHRACHNAQDKRPNKSGRVVKVGLPKPACGFCGKTVGQRWGEINQAERHGRPIYCDRKCSSAARVKSNRKEVHHGRQGEI